MTIRVVQWTTGNVGRRALRAVLRHPDLELVGCYAWSDTKVGCDVGELVGIDPVGITATDDVDALLACEPGCVSYNPIWPDVDEMCRILEAGVNISSTSAFITGRGMGAEAVDRLDECGTGRGRVAVRDGHQPGLRQPARPREHRDLRPGRPRDRSRVGRRHRVRVGRHATIRGLRRRSRRPRDGREVGSRVDRLRRCGCAHGRRTRRRPRRDRVRGRVRAALHATWISAS